MNTPIDRNMHESHSESSHNHHKIICPKPIRALIPKNPLLREFIENASESEELRGHGVAWSPANLTKIKILPSVLRSSSPSYETFS